MSTGQALTTQLRLDHYESSRSLTVFSPPGLYVETTRYPILQAGILASTEPLEWLSIYDHPESWRGMDRETILSMRRHLYSLVLPIDAREMQPKDHIETLQTISLSVAPVALGVEVGTLPPRHLGSQFGSQLPTSPVVNVRSLEILSNPEISKVAERITEKDIPAADAIWQLLDYEYSLEQVVRLMSIGLLGRKKNRRIIPMRSAYKAVIDSFIDRSIMELIDRPYTDDIQLYLGRVCNDSFTIVIRPGEPRVDYLKIEDYESGCTRGTSFESTDIPTTDAKTSIYADHARFSAYRHMLADAKQSHIIIFHHSNQQRNRILGPWVIRAGVQEALQSSHVSIDDVSSLPAILDSILKPTLSSWAKETPLLSRINEIEPDFILAK